MKTLTINLSNDEYLKIIKQLNSKEVLYNIGDYKNKQPIESKIKNILLNIESDLNNSNQLQYLECLGVDNWCGYCNYRYNSEDEIYPGKIIEDWFEDD